MNDSSQRIRLDEILVREGLISEEQIKEALTRQKAHGGKLGSQLLYHRAIDEAGLVHALAIQFNCEGVVLSGLEIPEIVTKLIPSKVAIARKIMPFDYDPERNLLKVACETPTDQSLINELNFVARGKEIKLYVAAELALNTAINQYYMGQKVNLEDRLFLDIPDDATGLTDESATSPDDQTELSSPAQPTVLLVTDEEYSGPLMASLLERDGFQVCTTDSADEAIDIIADRVFNSVLIKDTVPGDYIDLIDRLRKSSPRTSIRYYETASSLILDQGALISEGDLLSKNMELFTSLLALKSGQPDNHSGAVGSYVDKLCRQMQLPDKERLIIVNAAYLHDLSRHYYQPEEGTDQRSWIGLTARLLSSLQYPPVVVEMLRSMYKDLKGKYTKRLPVEIMGGNILTIVDLYCETVDPNEKLPLDKFDAIKKKCRDLAGRLFLPEVVEAFVAMIQNEVLHAQTTEKHGQVMLFTDNPSILYPIERRLQNEGFRTVSQLSRQSFVELCKRSEPDMMVLILKGDSSVVGSFVNDLENEGVDLARVPVFLMAESAHASEITALLDRGLEDIIPIDVNLDMLVSKLRKVQTRAQLLDSQLMSVTQPTAGSHGRLADMNVVDLLQALGPSRRTVKITITASSEDKRLFMYLDQGAVTYAELDELSGAPAVHEAITWSEGSWSVEPVSPDELPIPNNCTPNDALLLEGCRLMDERVRQGQLL
jgi:response regulator RpfG family c-di-GMP phosphodiesterase